MRMILSDSSRFRSAVMLQKLRAVCRVGLLSEYWVNASISGWSWSAYFVNSAICHALLPVQTSLFINGGVYFVIYCVRGFFQTVSSFNTASLIFTVSCVLREKPGSDIVQIIMRLCTSASNYNYTSKTDCTYQIFWIYDCAGEIDGSEWVYYSIHVCWPSAIREILCKSHEWWML